jgi:hypothetical protein
MPVIAIYVNKPCDQQTKVALAKGLSELFASECRVSREVGCRLVQRSA